MNEMMLLNLKELVRQKGDCKGIACEKCYFDNRCLIGHEELVKEAMCILEEGSVKVYDDYISLYDIIIFNAEGELKVDTITSINTSEAINGKHMTVSTAHGFEVDVNHIKKKLDNLETIKEELEE